MKNVIIGMNVGMACVIIGLLTFGSEQYVVPGWEHGVVLCDSGCIIIHVGHEGDPEVSELLALASKCSK